jgi:hypothetical protein
LHGTCSPQVFMLTLQNFRKKVQQNISPRSCHRFILQNGQSPETDESVCPWRLAISGC